MFEFLGFLLVVVCLFFCWGLSMAFVLWPANEGEISKGQKIAAIFVTICFLCSPSLIF